MITSNVINRTFRLKHRDGVGTCFTVDVAGRQYVVTAQHVVDGLAAGADAVVEILHDRRWKPLPVHVAWLAEDPVDVAILAARQPLSHPNMTLEPTSVGMTLGQQVYFLGFTNLEVLALPDGVGFPMPLVRQGIFAGMIPQNGNLMLVIDGHNIPGFSGGPVVFRPDGHVEYRVAGVISAYRYQRSPVFSDDEATELYVKDNSGLIIAYSFQAGVEHVSANPTGVEIRSE